MSLPPTSTLPTAFKLVHTILSANPSTAFTTRELVREGIALYASSSSAEATSSTSSANASTSTNAESKKVKGKNVKERNSPGVNVVPEGHPFVSTSFLKHRVLPILQSQDLIRKSVHHTSPITSTSSSSTQSPPVKSKPSFRWTLVSSPTTPSNLTTPAWSLPEHWNRLLSGETPGRLHAELTANKSSRKSEEKERAFDSGKLRRNEREIWGWEGREEGLTTRLERLHLNKRRGGKRPEKERRRRDQFGLLAGFEEGVNDRATV